MSEKVKITLPKLGESIVSATVVQWFKKKGDPVHLDEPLLEVSTDKVNSEIPAPFAGTLEEIYAEVDQEIAVGEPLALLSTEQPHNIPSSEEIKEEKSFSEDTSQQDVLSPAVIRLLQEHKISLDQVATIPRTGEGGRLTKKDIENFVSKKKCPKSAVLEVEKFPMSPMRKAIAQNMVKSFYEAPHASLITEVDVTEALKQIQEKKEAFFKEHKVKLTITSLIAWAMSRALKDYPLLNASLDQETILVKRYVNLGIAVSVDQGVMVPVIHGCEKKSVVEIAKVLASLAEKTRSNTLSAEETKEGTITLTNFGMTGTEIGIPIIRYPEVAILGLGAISKKVAVQEDDSIAIRSKTFISLTFDHRVLDGIYGCNFLHEVKAKLEKIPSDLIG